VTSIGGLVGKPFWGFYVASKFALEGYSESLRYEIAPFGISVSVVEPGGVKTDFWRSLQVTQHRISAYDWSRERVELAEREMEAGSSEPELVAGRILDIARSASPRLRHVVGRDATMVAAMRRFLPEPLFETGLKRMFHLNSKPNEATAASAAAIAEQGV
jgi:short-subunit dehydrogenase